MKFIESQPPSQKMQVFDLCLGFQKPNFSGSPPSSSISFDNKSGKHNFPRKPIQKYEPMEISRKISIGNNLKEKTKNLSPG